MKADIKVDTSRLDKALRQARLTQRDMIDIAGNGSKVIINEQRRLVPVDTAETKVSIGDHIVEASKTRVVDDVGPETDYATWLEYGTGEFAEGGNGRRGGWFYVDENGGHFTRGMHPRPFVRPSILENAVNITKAISAGFVSILRQRWPT
jgi:HK97 gp10 family phage protein